MRARTSIRLLPLGILMAVLLAATIAAPRLIPRADDAAAEEPLTVSLDMDAWDGGPCADIDATADHDCGSTYKVGLCVSGLYNDPDLAIGSFSFDVLYDDTLNTAPEVTDVAPALDDNPDANENEYGDGLGVAWACDNEGYAYPKGDKDPVTGPGHGDAFIGCGSNTGPYTMGDNETAGVIAVIEFQAKAGNTDQTDNLVIKTTSYLADPHTNKMGQCDPTKPLPIECAGGTDNKRGCGPGGDGAVGGVAELDPFAATAAPVGRNASAPMARDLAAVAAGGALLVMTGAWYARRRRRAG